MSTETSETGDSEEQPDEMPVQNLRNRLDTVDSGDELDVTYRSARSGNAITVSGEVTDRKVNAGAVWWVDIATEDGRTVRVEDSGDVETVREDGGTPTLGPVLDFQRDGVDEPEVMTDGGVDTTRGQRWSSKHPRRRERQREADRIQAKKERQMVKEALKHHAEQNPGAVAEVNANRMVDLSSEPGHVQKVLTDTGRTAFGKFRIRVRVMYVQYGLASDLTERLDDERVPAGDMTPEDVHPSALGTHVEFIAAEPAERLDDHVERVERYISERWDPDWTERERVSGQMGDADE